MQVLPLNDVHGVPANIKGLGNRLSGHGHIKSGATYLGNAKGNSYRDRPWTELPIYGLSHSGGRMRILSIAIAALLLPIAAPLSAQESIPR